MQTNDIILNDSFFIDYFKNHLLNDTVDELTGLINNRTFKSYISYLINKKEKFSIAYLELDNFSNLIDIYGDDVGNKVLKDVSKNLFQFLEQNGVVARIGSSKLGFILLNKTDYKVLHDYYQAIMHSGKILRKNVHCGLYSPFVTATIASVSYPNDVSNLDEAEDKLQKALYRGKCKGRNCFIIWVEEKHKDIVINPLYKETFDKKIRRLFQMFESRTSYSVSGDDMPFIFNYVRDDFLIEYLFYVDENYKVYDSTTAEVLGKIKNIDKYLDEDGTISFNYLKDVKDFNQELYYIYDDLGIESSYLLKMNRNNKFYGYFIFATKRTSRLWDAKEKITLFLLGQLYARYLEEHKLVGIQKLILKK